MPSRRAFLVLGVDALVASAAVCAARESISSTADGGTTEATPSRPPASPRFSIGEIIYATLAEALAALQDGQTLDIAPGLHSGEAGYSRASNVTIRASAEAAFDSVHGGKSTFVLAGHNVTLQNLAGVGITNASRNGGLIRFEGRHLTASGIRIDRCETGILTGNAHVDSIVRLSDIKGKENGTPGDGQSHAIYVGACAELHVTNADLADTFIGHLIKSRAARNVIAGCRLIEGRASRAIDICNGGVLEIANTYIKQTQATDNPELIGYGASARGTRRACGCQRIPSTPSKSRLMFVVSTSVNLKVRSSTRSSPRPFSITSGHTTSASILTPHCRLRWRRGSSLYCSGNPALCRPSCQYSLAMRWYSGCSE